MPVYQKKALNLTAYIEDISPVDHIWIDAELTKDTDGDGDTANDRDSLDPATTFGIKKGSTIYDLDIGVFDTLFTRKIRLFSEDSNGNVSSKDLTLTVYPPVPEIDSITGDKISGSLSEALGDEPIDIFRLRNGGLSRLKPLAPDTGKTAADGTFTLDAKDTKGLVLTQSGRNIASINERT